MLKQLGPRFVVYGLACGGDARTARFVVNFVAQRICAKTCKVVFANSSCGSAATLLFAPLFWSENAPVPLNKARGVKSLSDNAETLNSKIKVSSSSWVPMIPNCIASQLLGLGSTWNRTQPLLVFFSSDRSSIMLLYVHPLFRFSPNPLHWCNSCRLNSINAIGVTQRARWSPPTSLANTIFALGLKFFFPFLVFQSLILLWFLLFSLWW